MILIQPSRFAEGDRAPGALNWADITGFGSSNAAQTVSGTTADATFRATFTGVTTVNCGGSLLAFVNAAAPASGLGSVAEGASFDFVVPPGGSVNFQLMGGYGLGSPTFAATVTITNLSDGGATLDTFTLAI